MTKKFQILMMLIIALFFVNCGGGGSSSETKQTAQGTLYDDAVVGADYKTKGFTAKTDKDGKFNYTEGKVEFYLENLKIGEISSLAKDKKVFLCDMLNLKRGDYTTTKLVKLARLLQSLDTNKNDDVITLDNKKIKTLFTKNQTIDDIDITKLGLDLVSDVTAQEEVKQTYIEHGITPIEPKEPTKDKNTSDGDSGGSSSGGSSSGGGGSPTPPAPTIKAVAGDDIYINTQKDIELNASKSTTSSGTITNYKWINTDTNVTIYSGSDSNATIKGTTLSVGENNITLTVTASTGLTDSDELKIFYDTTKPTARIKSYNENAVIIIFSEAIEQPIKSDFNFTDASTSSKVDFNLTFEDNKTVALNPATGLKYDTKYEINITNNIEDRAGNKIDPTNLSFIPFAIQAKLLKTGQTKSYVAGGVEVTDGSIKDDGYYQKGQSRNYTRANDIVTDHVTGLEWQDNAEVASKEQNWTKANTYCQNLTLDINASKPWRLPTIDELETIIAYERKRGDPLGSKGSIDSVFENVGQNGISIYWSSTNLCFNTSWAWWVSFVYSDMNTNKNESYYVRCTRGKKIVKMPVTDNYDNTVTDRNTGLMWEDSSHVVGVDNKVTWKDAITYCETLDLGGHTDWRLPNIIELKSITDRTKTEPSFKEGFTQKDAVHYWSSTTTLDDNTPAWAVFFNDGYNLHRYKTYSSNVRCVRH